MKLYDSLSSGNCYKARLLLALLGVPYERIDVNTAEGETRTPEFLAMNPNGRVPVLQTDDGGHLAESNAILIHLARDSRSCPTIRGSRRRSCNGCSSSSTATSPTSPWSVTGSPISAWKTTARSPKSARAATPRSP